MAAKAAGDDTRYWASISYSHKDAAFGRRLHRKLESYVLPRRLSGAQALPRRLVPIFRDRDELPAAGDLSTEVRAALAQSRSLIVVCSPQAAASQWVHREVALLKKAMRKSADVGSLQNEPARQLAGEGEINHFGIGSSEFVVEARGNLLCVVINGADGRNKWEWSARWCREQLAVETGCRDVVQAGEACSTVHRRSGTAPTLDTSRLATLAWKRRSTKIQMCHRSGECSWRSSGRARYACSLRSG